MRALAFAAVLCGVAMNGGVAAGPVPVIGAAAMSNGYIMGTTDSRDGRVNGWPEAGTVFRLKLTPSGIGKVQSFGLCFYWHDCDRFGLPIGAVKPVGPNTISGKSEDANGRSTCWTFEYRRGRTILTTLQKCP